MKVEVSGKALLAQGDGVDSTKKKGFFYFDGVDPLEEDDWAPNKFGSQPSGYATFGTSSKTAKSDAAQGIEEWNNAWKQVLERKEKYREEWCEAKGSPSR